MTTKHLRIAAYFSSGPHYRKVLSGLRDKYPGARIIAVIPPRYPEVEAAALADEVSVTAQDAYCLSRPKALFALLRWLRAQQFDVFVVMFPSPKLSVLARLSGAPERYCHRIDGHFEALRVPIFQRVITLTKRRVEGYLTYRHIRLNIDNHPVESKTKQI